MRLPTRIPTIVGILLTIIIVGVVAFVGNQMLTPSKASGAQEPVNVHTANVTDVTFTLSWLTGSPATGTLLVSATNKNDEIYYDERDITGKLGTYITHSVTIRDALPNTQYSIKILSNSIQYINDGKPYTIQTAPALTLNSNGLSPAYGTIMEPDGKTPIEGSLVYLTINGGQELSALTKSSGLWLIPLNQVRSNDLNQYLPITNRITETIIARYNDLTTTATTDTLNDSPVPEMTLGKTYDFRHQQANVGIANQQLAQNTAPTALGAVLGQSITKTFSITLTQPAQGAALTSPIPLIAGTGIPNKYVGISLGIINPQSGSAKVDEDGLWSFTPQKPLNPGNQSVTILSTDINGKPIAITHSFEIFKGGTQVLGDATPSATIEPTDTPTPQPTEESTSTLSGQAPPNTGYELPTILLLIMGLGLFVGGTIAVARVDIHS